LLTSSSDYSFSSKIIYDYPLVPYPIYSATIRIKKRIKENQQDDLLYVSSFDLMERGSSSFLVFHYSNYDYCELHSLTIHLTRPVHFGHQNCAFFRVVADMRKYIIIENKWIFHKYSQVKLTNGLFNQLF
jgi:hypothetical protein